MQYKIPLQIENEDTIVAGLSIRQLVVMMMWGGVGYAIFRALEGSLGPKWALIFAIPPVIIGIIVAMVKIAEMTFLPTILNYFRLQLNDKQRMWSLGTDSFSDMEIGYVTLPNEQKDHKNNTSLESKMSDEISTKIGKL
jgi:PrgI family protein